MKKDPEILLGHILESIVEIEKCRSYVTKEKFSKMTMVQDAVIRRIQIIGEAVKKLPTEFKRKYPKIAWAEIAGMRDVLIHDYFGVNINVVWKTIQEDIPKLRKQITKLVKQQAIDVLLQAQKEPCLSGDLDELMKKIK